MPTNNLPTTCNYQPESTGANHPPGVVGKAWEIVRGRTPKINEKIVAQILESLRDGETIEKTCKSVGINKSTFYEWKAVNPDFFDAVERTRLEWTDSLVDKGLNQLENVQAEGKEDSARVRKAECLARHTLEIASRLNPKYSQKQQTTNLNVNVDVSPVDMDKYR